MSSKPFKLVPRFERLLVLKRKDPSAFTRLPAAVKMQLGYYATAKAAARPAKSSKTPPPDAA